MKEMYRIMEIKDGDPLTLFHGVGGSRRVKEGEWIVAEKKSVYDGSAGTPYISGFHCLPSVEACEAYMNRFTADRELGIFRIEAEGLRPKTHSPAPVWLADEMFVIERIR